MTNYFGDIAQPKGVAPEAAPQATQSLNLMISPLKRAEFKGFMEGMEANTPDPMTPMTPMLPPQTQMQQMLPPPQQLPMPMMDGGVVDIFDPVYMRNGGDVYAEKEKFTSNIKTGPGQTISGRGDVIKEQLPKYNKFDEFLARQEEQIKNPILVKDRDLMEPDDDTFDAMGGFGGTTYAGRNDPYREDRSTPTIAPVTSASPNIMAGSQYDPQFRSDQGFIDSFNNPFAQYTRRFTDPIFEAQGFDMGTDAGRYQAYLTTQRNAAQQERDQIQRRKRLDKEEAEQRSQQELRDMIAGMMPQQTPTIPSPIIDPIIDPPSADKYSDPVVPSDRIPGFNLANLNPYPDFGMSVSPISPGLSPELIRRLFAMQGESMPSPISLESGGEVLDNAVEKLIGNLRSAA